MDAPLPSETPPHVNATQHLPDPLRRVLMLTLIPVVFLLTAPLALVPLIMDPTGFAPISLGSRIVLIVAVGAATATPILAGANAASLASSNPLTVPPRAIRQKTIDVMGWTWSGLAGLIPAALLALLHQRVGYELFWCIHTHFDEAPCLPVDYGVVVPSALPNIMPTFSLGLLTTVVVTWAALRVGVMVGRRVRHPARAVMWVTGQMIVVVVLILGLVLTVLQPERNPNAIPEGPQAHHVQPVEASCV